MENKNLKTRVIHSLFWKFLERIGVQGIQFIVTIILARILSPEDYGILAIITVFIYIAQVFISNGFGTALIQKKDTTDIDFSSVFYLNLIVALIFYLLLFFTAPLISSFYEEPIITPVLRIISINIFIGVANSIQTVILTKALQFKKLFISSLGAIILSGTLGILLAYFNMGIWSLVAQQLSGQLTLCIVMWFTVKWRPKRVFSITRIKVLFNFGGKILLSHLIYVFIGNIRSLIIARMYNSSILGFYTKGEQIPKLITSSIDGSIQTVIFPALSLEQNDKIIIKNIMKRGIKTSVFILFPSMIGLAAIADNLILVLLTEKWLYSVPFFQLACFYYIVSPIHAINLQGISALGRSDIFLKLELIKSLISIIIFIVSVFFGIYAIAFGMVIVSIICTFVNSYPNLKLINYGFIEQIKDVLPSLFISIAMGFIVYFLKFINISPILTLLIQVTTGVISFILLSKIFKIESFIYLIQHLNKFVKKFKKN